MRNYSSIHYILGSRQSCAETGGQAVKTDFRSRSKGQGQFLTVKNLDRGRERTYGECLSDHPLCVSVCLRVIWHCRHQAGILAIRTASARQARENVCVASAKSTAFDLEKPPGSKDSLRDPAH